MGSDKEEETSSDEGGEKRAFVIRRGCLRG